MMIALSILASMALVSVSSETGDVTVDCGGMIEYAQRAESGMASFRLSCEFPEWEDDAYVFLPACAYNGNRDARETYAPQYPPRTTAEGSGTSPVLERSQYPGLKADGSGEIAVTSGDLSVPCAGVWMPGAKKGFLVFTEQQVGGLNIGYTVRRGLLRVDFPANRRRAYRSCTANAISPDPKLLFRSGQRVSARTRTVEFAAESVSEFLERFFRERKCLLRSERAGNGYTKALWRVTEDAWNTPALWSGECYHQEPAKYVPGWTGGPHHVYPLFKMGGPLTRERAVATLDFQVRHQAKSGYYYGRVVDGRDVVDEELCGPLDGPGRTMVRKTAECLYFFIRCGRLMGWRDSWRASCEKAADALVRTWDEHGQFGQWVDVETGRVLVGRSDSAAIAPAALLDAWREFGKDEYRRVAFASCEAYCRDLDRGVTYGGPGDALMAPDSESAFALLESCVALAEETKDEKWIARSRQAAALASTWVVSYRYAFPESSTLGRLGVNTVGAVFANVQNKHAAPGICTLSGDSLLRLYRLTGDRDYLELCKDIAYFIPQCVSRPDRPIYAKEGNALLPPGWVNERVSTSDFAGFGQIGEMFYAACWSGTSLLMSWADLLSQPEFDETPEEDFHSWAPTPPMGWNSWDCYGTLIDEAAYKANADWQAAHLLKHGYDTCVVDIRWTVQNETGANDGYNQKDPVFTLDEWGRYLPDPRRFPSSADGAGFRPLADYAHAKGLRFGIHIMRGVPREAVERKLPVKGADGITCDAISDGRQECWWLKDNYGIDPGKRGAQEYYDSIVALYASWGVDFIKCDDMSFYPYHAGEIELLRRAIDRCGRAIVLSLSPGETPLDRSGHVAEHANMWRIVGDLWDDWKSVDHLTDVACDWLAKPRVKGAWPDCDMIPLGRLCLRAFDGERQSRLSSDEGRYLMTLMAAVRSPLMIGSDLPSLDRDPETLALLTDPVLLALHRDGVSATCVKRTREECAIVVAMADGSRRVALFNRTGKERWISAAEVSATLPPHSATIINGGNDK